VSYFTDGTDTYLLFNTDDVYAVSNYPDISLPSNHIVGKRRGF
jgi:hypothetical protein